VAAAYNQWLERHNQNYESSRICYLRHPGAGPVAIILTTADRARHLKPRPAYLAGYGQRLHVEVAGRIGSLADYMGGGRRSAKSTCERLRLSGSGHEGAQWVELEDQSLISGLYARCADIRPKYLLYSASWLEARRRVNWNTGLAVATIDSNQNRIVMGGGASANVDRLTSAGEHQHVTVGIDCLIPDLNTGWEKDT